MSSVVCSKKSPRDFALTAKNRRTVLVFYILIASNRSALQKDPVSGKYPAESFAFISVDRVIEFAVAGIFHKCAGVAGGIYATAATATASTPATITADFFMTYPLSPSVGGTP